MIAMVGESCERRDIGLAGSMLCITGERVHCQKVDCGVDKSEKGGQKRCDLQRGL